MCSPRHVCSPTVCSDSTLHCFHLSCVQKHVEHGHSCRHGPRGAMLEAMQRRMQLCTSLKGSSCVWSRLDFKVRRSTMLVSERRALPEHAVRHIGPSLRQQNKGNVTSNRHSVLHEHVLQLESPVCMPSCCLCKQESFSPEHYKQAVITSKQWYEQMQDWQARSGCHVRQCRQDWEI